MAGSAAEERLRLKAVEALRRARPGARIAHELNMAGSGSIRLDLAAVDLEHLILVEIKSERDKLDRLKDQLRAAQDVANEVWLVITVRHAEKIIAAANFITGRVADAELYELLGRTKVLIENTAGELQILTRGSGDWPMDGPPQGLFPDPRALWAVLWANEMRAELSAWGCSSSMAPMTRFAVDSLTGRQIRQAVCRQLRARPFARADAPVGREPKLDLALAAE